LCVRVLEEGHERLQTAIIPQTRTIKAQVIGCKGGVGFWALGSGCWVLGAGFWVLGYGSWETR
jgi:hypothetical protein